MFNVIMRHFDWDEGSSSMRLDRMFEDTEAHLRDQFKDGDLPDLKRLTTLPCLFIPEGTGDQVCRVGSITRSRISNGEVTFDYTLDADIPPFRNAQLFAKKGLLDMNTDRHNWYWSRNHWAVKDVDLYRVLLGIAAPKRQRPTAFTIPDTEEIDQSLVSVMMPFSAEFNGVYAAIQTAVAQRRMVCNRADDIWDHSTIIQDVVSLIDRARVVICDCTGRNANVFYEAGIAHTLGRDVIFITQNAGDIPFDLAHIRYVTYHNNTEGLAALAATIEGRLKTLIAG
jgi:hypothetical protein